ncbi:hypothetical protein AF72_06190 [Xylella taiwanensis]|uniref:Uncharacterized protein n=1 Tax=Xylella taiwanensis TaxID=1444770 RepID=Z9JIV6_9GAMM|nr:hypothetical protein AB672_01015 [Xylella taiwanensis]EWS78345.1 hypothetical protein AF72_06190 [Xylella taiwanensis]
MKHEVFKQPHSKTDGDTSNTLHPITIIATNKTSSPRTGTPALHQIHHQNATTRNSMQITLRQIHQQQSVQANT